MHNAPNGGDKRRIETGMLGEEAAFRYLTEAGYKVLERNWRCRSGEIDLIASYEGRLIFIEVRTRREGGRFGTAAESVDRKKQQQVRNTAAVYLRSAGKTAVPVRFDVVTVQMSAAGQTITDCKHYENAF